MSVRVAVEGDEHAVIALWRSCDLIVSYNDPSSDFRVAISHPCSCVLVNEDESGEVDGTAMVGFDGHRGWLYYVAAATHVQGTGLGRKMVEAGEQWLRDREVAKVQLLVRETNTKVLGFYKHLGFETAPRIVMGKWLETR